MKDNSQPNLIPLIFIIAGSCLLALPGAYGAMFLFMFAFEGAGSNPLAFFLPFPAVIGFSLLFGYIWTIVTKRFIGWLWGVSFFFNLIASVISVFGAFYFFMDVRGLDGYAILFVLFPVWTVFVTVASAYYFFHGRSAGKVSLP